MIRIPYRKAATFIIKWLKEPGAPRSITMAGWNDDDELASAFAKHFELATVPHHEWELVVIRLRRLLKKMWEDGALDRWSQSNYDRYTPDEPKWQYGYILMENHPWVRNHNQPENTP